MKMRATTLWIALAASVTGAAYGQVRPKITGVSHLSVYASDAAKTEHFYVHDLGAFKAADPQNPAGVRYYFNSIQFVEVLPLPGDLMVIWGWAPLLPILTRPTTMSRRALKTALFFSMKSWLPFSASTAAA